MTKDEPGSSNYSQCQWSNAIAGALPPDPARTVKWVSVATLRGVPAFVRGFVKSKFPQEKSRWTLLDWHGLLAKNYALQPSQCNVLVFGGDGHLVFRTGGRDPDPAAVTAVIEAINTASQVIAR